MGTINTLSGQIREKMRGGMSREQAAAEARQAYDNMGPVNVPNPTGEQLQEALRRDIAPVQRMYRDFQPTLLDKPEVMQRRFEYSKKCRDALTKLAAEDAERDIIFEQTADRLFSDTFGKENVRERVSARRWMWQLIDNSNTPEATAHNEEVVSLVMLAESSSSNDIERGRKTFRQMRYDHYIKTGMAEAQAAEKADYELEHGVERLMELTLQAADREKIGKEEADRARDAILSGEAENMPGGLEAAYRKIINPSSAIGWNILNITHDFKDFGMEIPDDVYDAKFRPYVENSSTTHNAIIQQVANPFYAIFDGAELVNAGGLQLGPRKGESFHYSAIMDFGSDGATGLSQTRIDTMAQSLNRFALNPKQDVALLDKANNINIFSNERGRTVIMQANNINIDNGFHMDIRSDIPGCLINDGLEKKLRTFKENSVRNDKLFRSSGQYRDMKRALNRLAETKLPDDPTEQQVKEFAEKVKAVQDAAKAYNKRKADQLAERGAKAGKDDYEKYRINFGKELEKYADHLAKRTRLVQEHIDTMKKVMDAEQMEENLRKDGIMPEVDPNVSAFQRSVKAEDDRIAARERAEAEAKRLAEEEAARKAKEEEQKQREQDAVVGKKFDKALNDAEKSADMTKLPNDLGRGAGPTLRDAIDKTKTAYENALNGGDAKEANRLGRELVATMAVNEMVKCGYGFDSQLGDRFRNLAECGGLEALKNQMQQHAKFTSRMDGKDFSMKQTFIDNADNTASIVGKQAVKELLAKMRQDRDAQKLAAQGVRKSGAPQRSSDAPQIQQNQQAQPVLGGPM